ncbi:MAG: hypothetical protein KJ559_00425, partial [Nanoarchaeota archaeon]|nr:hypothetical protein [Nanoarchaeota archaeon]
PSSIEPTTSQEPESQGPSADNFIPVVEESTLEEPQGPSAGVVRVEKHLPEEPGFVENLWSGIVDTVVDFFTPETETPKEPSQEIFATDIVLEESQQEQIPEEEGLVIPADFVVTVPDGEIPETTLVSGELDELKCNGRYEGSTCSYVDLQIATRGCSKKNEKCIECSLVNGVYHKAEGRCDFEVEHEKMA